MGKRQRWMITIGCFLGYFLFGCVDNMKGVTLPVILRDVGYDHSLGGTIISSEYAGFFLATFLAGLLADLWGKKITLVLAGLCLIFGAAGYASSSCLLMFIGFIFLIGIGLGALELSGSNILSGIWGGQKGRYLNLLNACYGVGAVLTPVLAGYLLDLGISWRGVYRYSLFVIVPVTGYFIIMRFPKEEQKNSRSKKVDLKELCSVILHRNVLCMYVMIFMYVAAEIGMATWAVGFLQKEKQMSAAGSAMYLSAYFVCMTVGRLLGSLFVDRVGHLKSLLTFSVLAGVFLAVGIFGPPSTAIFLVFTGLGFSIIFPTATTVVSEIPSKNPGILLGIFLGFGGVGGMAGPYLIGVVNDLFGMKAGMAIDLVFCAVVVTALLIIMKGEEV